MTQLISLEMSLPDSTNVRFLSAMGRLPQLQHFGFKGTLHSTPPADTVKSVLCVSAQLTSLALQRTVDQAAFDLLLKHGTQLTKVTLGGLLL
jgi:hypothetical protein